MNRYSPLEQLIRHLPDNYIINKVVTYSRLSKNLLTDRALLNINRQRFRHVDDIQNQPLVSVVIPTYNRGSLLVERGLKSVQNQTYTKLEIIIVNDGSNDDTIQLVNDLRDPRIRLINNVRDMYRYPSKAFYHWLSGPVEAINLGLKAATGTWIARNDDDDIWHPEHVEHLINYVSTGPYEFVSSAYTRVDTHSSVSTIINTDPLTNIGGTATWLFRSYLRFMHYSMHSWRRTYYRVNDTDFQYRVWMSGARIGFLDIPLVTVTQRPDEMYIGSQAYINNPNLYDNLYQ